MVPQAEYASKNHFINDFGVAYRLTSRPQYSTIHWLKREAFRFTHPVDGHNQVKTS
jgi:hypothetical protein